jgi:hypothetical protein
MEVNDSQRYYIVNEKVMNFAAGTEVKFLS